MKDSSVPSRRSFLQTGLVAGTAAMASTLRPGTLFGQETPSSEPSERVRFVAIGTGGKGRNNIQSLLRYPDAELVGFADVDAAHRDQTLQVVQEATGKSDIQAVNDYRKLLDRDDVDAVVVSTPDHWHALAAVHALQAGKDVYCEKPLTNSVGEGRKVCEAVAANNRVLQTGSHERSNPRVRRASELVQAGLLGKIREVRINMPTEQAHHQKVATFGAAPEPTMPPGELDYDRWLGPAPCVPYIADRVHFWWRFVLSYGGGEMTDRGAHIIDIAQMALGLDDTGPVRFMAIGNRADSELYDAFMDYVFVNEYANGLRVVGVDDGPRGLKFIGDDGWLMVHVHGGELEASDPQILEHEGSVDEGPLGRTESHHRNFLDAVKSRQQPHAPAEAGHRTASICHINNIAMRLGRPLNWDPQAERFVDDEEANALLMPEMRPGYTL